MWENFQYIEDKLKNTSNCDGVSSKYDSFGNILFIILHIMHEMQLNFKSTFKKVKKNILYINELCANHFVL